MATIRNSVHFVASLSERKLHMNTINNESATKKSKTQICSALMRLLKTKPYRKISVSQICSCAGISRTTFYKNFDSLDAVVLYKLTLIEKDYNKQYSADDDIRVHFVDLYTLIRKSRDFDLLFVKSICCIFLKSRSETAIFVI